MHIKDYEGELLGDGRVDIAGSLAALREIGYDDWLVLETPSSGDPAVEQKEYLEFTRALFE